MNFLKLSFFFLLVVAMSACGNDDDGPTVCTQSDWVGTYEGTVTCDGAAEAVTVTIAANGAVGLDVSYATAGSTIAFTDPLTPVSCDLDATATDAGTTLTIDATLDGDKLTFKEVLTISGTTTTCDISATRK